jgi:hypothetical protein
MFSLGDLLRIASFGRVAFCNSAICCELQRLLVTDNALLQQTFLLVQPA